MKLTQEELKEIVSYFKDKPVLRAYIFGSYARNDASFDSDIDILVELDYTMHIGIQFIKMKLDLEEKLKKKVDLISYNSLSKYLSPIINSEKQMIYER